MNGSWENFYVILGSSAAALIGIQFVVVTLVAIALAACGVSGLGYGAVVIVRERRQTHYAPVWQDWLWYGLLPCSANAALALGGLFLRARGQTPRFVIAAAALGLLFIGVHNAWDSVTHLVLTGGGVETSGDH